ncbi:IS1595 family transposase [Methylocystis echinoides]|uniref:IS1595 family transposase n=1 Tax=Methylocystis echinoides TaxID=29468 RepID=UPI00342ED130
MSVLSKPYFHDEAAAFAHLESVLWPEGPVCPHCGSVSGKHYDLHKTRMGLRKCSDCRKQFTVKVGTVFESAHIPLNKMLQAVYLMTSSKKGISAHQLHRVLEVQYKTAWFLAHRIREAMRDGTLAPMGGAGGVVEADETYFGKTADQPGATTSGRPFAKGGKRGPAGKRAVVALVERGGSVRSFHVDKVNKKEVAKIVGENIDRETKLYTDESRLYPEVGKSFAEHSTVRHSAEEYVRYEGESAIHTNTIEGYFSIFKRGMKGVYQHCGEKHLHRYLAEFDFRYNNRSARGCEDQQRASLALRGIVGKRLTYRWPDEAAEQNERRF